MAGAGPARGLGAGPPGWRCASPQLLLISGRLVQFRRRARAPDMPMRIQGGKRAPEFTLPDAAGRPVALADLSRQEAGECWSSTAAAGDRSACRAPRSWRPSSRDAEQAGVEIIAISPDPTSEASSSPRACTSAYQLRRPTATSRWRVAMASCMRVGAGRAGCAAPRPRWCWTGTESCAGSRSATISRYAPPQATWSRGHPLLMAEKS